MAKDMSPKTRAAKVLEVLSARYPMPETMLAYKNPWQLLVAVILSAQCTDARVNMVTPELFRRWPGPEELADAGIEELEEVIRSCGFYHNKAKNILACAKMAHNLHNDHVPQTMDELLKFPGVARKTANVVLFAGFGINAGVAVDTHVKRVSHRLGLTGHTDPVLVEKELMAIFPREEWGNINHRMVWFGRDVCKARKPDCPACELERFCPKKEPGKSRN